MSRRPDRQRARVYNWEDAQVAPRHADRQSFAAAQSMVDAIWAELGLRYPPAVEPLPRQSRRLQADANRLRLRLPPEFPGWLLLHELAHALSSTAEGDSDGHGPRFMGLYLQLLERFLRLSADELAPSLRAAGIDWDPRARPLFLET